jgi:hypothetical protein
MHGGSRVHRVRYLAQRDMRPLYAYAAICLRADMSKHLNEQLNDDEAFEANQRLNQA